MASFMNQAANHRLEQRRKQPLGTIMHRKLAGGRILGAARKLVADPSFKEGKALDYGGCTQATGPFWGLFIEPLLVPRHHHGL
eukprot:superscaffoldBa00003124_g16182